MNESDVKYHARDLQVKAITLEANNHFDRLIAEHTTEFTLLDGLLMTPPFLMPHIIRQSGYSADDYYRLAFDATSIAAKRNLVLSVFVGLEAACNELNRRDTEIQIAGTEIPQAFKSAFESYPEKLLAVSSEAMEEGVSTVLQTLEGDTPLMRYRRDLAAGKFKLSPIINGGEVTTVDTKIPNVGLRLLYIGQDRNPKLSLSVKQFAA